MIYPRTFYIETYGCTFNQADSAKIAHLLLDFHYLPSSRYHAEFIIINTCAVKSQTEAKILHRIESLPLQEGQKILITGCLPWISDKILTALPKLNKKIRGIFDPNSYSHLQQLLESVNTTKNICIDKAPKDGTKSKIIPWISQYSAPGIIQISEGCNMSCTYCCTHISRGKAISYPLEDILDQIQFYIDKGTKEIFLTGQDCGFYHWESLQVVDLVREIEKKYGNENIFIRIGMIDPIRPEKIIELAHILQESQIFYKFLHLPIQSASDNILHLMKRGYTKSNLDYLFQSIQKYKITISTDIICGFPYESEEDFLQTYDFVNKYQPDIMNISKFTPRPNTEAKKMPQLDSNIIKKRTLLLTNLYIQYQKHNNLRWKGWKGKALIHGFQPNKPMKFSCRNEFYKSVVLDKGEINKFVTVEIINSSGQFLTGKIVDD